MSYLLAARAQQPSEHCDDRLRLGWQAPLLARPVQAQVHEQGGRVLHAVAAAAAAARGVAAAVLVAAAALGAAVVLLLQVRDEPLDDAAVDHALADGASERIFFQNFPN